MLLRLALSYETAADYRGLPSNSAKWVNKESSDTSASVCPNTSLSGRINRASPVFRSSGSLPRTISSVCWLASSSSLTRFKSGRSVILRLRASRSARRLPFAAAPSASARGVADVTTARLELRERERYQLPRAMGAPAALALHAPPRGSW